jgi:hypothetical protein
MKKSLEATQGDTVGWLPGPSSAPIHEAVSVLYRNNDYDGVLHILRFVLRQAMNVADIWAYCPVPEREPESLMPNYKWYFGGLRSIGIYIMRDIQDAFSTYPTRVREQLKIMN